VLEIFSDFCKDLFVFLKFLQNILNVCVQLMQGAHIVFKYLRNLYHIRAYYLTSSSV